MRLLSLLILFVFAGCSRIDLDLSTATDARLLIYESGRIATECDLSDSQRAHIQDWLNRHNSGWSPSLDTWVPATYVTGTGFSINFMPFQVVVNYAPGQYTLEADSSEYPVLSCP